MVCQPLTSGPEKPGWTRLLWSPPSKSPPSLGSQAEDKLMNGKLQIEISAGMELMKWVGEMTRGEKHGLGGGLGWPL